MEIEISNRIIDCEALLTARDGLLALEHEGWRSLLRGDRSFYAELLDSTAVIVFPEPVGVIDGEQLVAAIDATNPWVRYEIELPHIVDFDSDAAILTYYVTAQRPEQSEYHA